MKSWREFTAMTQTLPCLESEPSGPVRQGDNPNDFTTMQIKALW